MAEATNQQMQVYADTRLRPFAELLRAVKLAALDHQSAIDDIYARAVGTSRWDDGRLDGPPHLLKSGNSASPDDMLNFNSILYKLNQLFTGTFGSQAEANEFAAQWNVLVDACVRSVPTNI